MPPFWVAVPLRMWAATGPRSRMNETLTVTRLGAAGASSARNVRELQRTLVRAAKGRATVPCGFDKVVRSDVLARAWGSVRGNRGAAGIDQTTIIDVEQYGIHRPLGELAADLRDGRYRPPAARRVFIPKPGSGSDGRCRFPRSATGSCKPPRGSCSSRSSRRAFGRVQGRVLAAQFAQTQDVTCNAQGNATATA